MVVTNYLPMFVRSSQKLIKTSPNLRHWMISTRQYRIKLLQTYSLATFHMSAKCNNNNSAPVHALSKASHYISSQQNYVITQEIIDKYFSLYNFRKWKVEKEIFKLFPIMKAVLNSDASRADQRLVLSDIQKHQIAHLIHSLSLANLPDYVQCKVLSSLFYTIGLWKDNEKVLDRLTEMLIECKVELDHKTLSAICFGLKNLNLFMDTELSAQMRLLLRELNRRVENCPTNFDSQAVSNAVFGLQSLYSKEEEVRILIKSLAVKVMSCEEPFSAQAVGNTLYGLKRFRSEHEEVRTLVGVLATKIQGCNQILNAQAVHNAFFGLQGLCSVYSEVRELLRVLKLKIFDSSGSFQSQGVGNALYGLRRMSSEHEEVVNLLPFLTKKVSESTQPVSIKDMGRAFYGLQGMSSEKVEVLNLLKALTLKLQNCGKLNAYAVSNLVYGLRNMTSDYPEVLDALKVISKKIKETDVILSTQEACSAVYGLQGMSSEHDEVLSVVQELALQVSKCRITKLTNKEFGQLIYGLKRLNSDRLEVRQLVGAIATHAPKCTAALGAREVGKIVGFEGLSSEHSEVRSLVKAIAVKVSECPETFDDSFVNEALHGPMLHRMSPKHPEVRSLVRALVGKAPSHTCFLTGRWEPIRMDCEVVPINEKSLSRLEQYPPAPLEQYIPTISKQSLYPRENQTLKASNTRTLAADEHRGFKILGIQQIAIGSCNKMDLAHFWGDLLGLVKVGTYRAENENVDEDIYKIGSGVSAVEVDLMQPIDPDKSPKVHIPALNHVGLWVDDLPSAVSYLTAKGVKFTPGGIRKGAAGHDVTFIHPKSAVGVLVELVQAPTDVINSHS